MTLLMSALETPEDVWMRHSHSQMTCPNPELSEALFTYQRTTRTHARVLESSQ